MLTRRVSAFRSRSYSYWGPTADEPGLFTRRRVITTAFKFAHVRTVYVDAHARLISFAPHFVYVIIRGAAHSDFTRLPGLFSGMHQWETGDSGLLVLALVF